MIIPISDYSLKTKNMCQSWFSRLFSKPRTRQELMQMLQLAQRRQLLDRQDLKMLEGVLQISKRQVRDIMVPFAKIIAISDSAPLLDILHAVIDSGHSRFPVIGNQDKEVSGLLFAKDLLRYNSLISQSQPDQFNILDILRPAVFIPESKRLDSLLEEFQHKHYHMAIVVDEYGTVSGLITIEDVLEEIVGEIEDEYDNDDEIFIQEQSPQQFTVKALMPIEDFNHYFKAQFPTDQFDTIGGFVANRFAYLPKRGAHITINTFDFKVLRADNRQIRLLQVNIPHSCAKKVNHDNTNSSVS